LFCGVLAQQGAVIAPHRVDRLVLVSTSAGMLDLLSQPKALARLGCSLTTARRGTAAGALFGGRVRDDPDVLERLHITPPHSVKAHLYRLAGLAGWYEMPWSVRRPTLVLTGDDDPLVPVGNAQVLASLITGARLVVVPGGGHLMLFDSPDEAGPIVADFLASRADGGLDAAEQKGLGMLAGRPGRGRVGGGGVV
jgi:pimeloyl-ACP methyl ester carboxylesterase